MSKADFTKHRLYTVAMNLFARHGFENTTMRAIAEKAEVALGASYYYFESKESLIQEFYAQSHEQLVNRLGDYLKTERCFEKRLHQVLKLRIELAEPHKKFRAHCFTK